jgi:hypothetical protein
MPNPVIRSQAISIGELLRLGSFKPARVQRDYCWTENQQGALLQDLISAFGEFGLDPELEPDTDAGTDLYTDAAFDIPDYNRELEVTEPYVFVGTVVLHQADKHFDIYDGLQRLTTFTVFFAVLRDLMEAERKHPVNQLLADQAGISRLSLSMKHNTLEADILAPGRTAKRHRPHPQLTEASHCLRTCVNTARSMLKGWSARRLAAFATFLAEGAIVTVTRISDRRMSAKAFVSINSGGLPLKPEEIVKGQLIDLTSALTDADEQAKRVLSVWNGIQDDLGPAGFDDFLRSVDFIERRMPQSSDYSIQLMEHIRRQYPGQAGVRWATDRLLQYRSAFKWIHEENNAEIADGVHASLRRLQLLKWDQWRAFAMLIKMKSKPVELASRIDALDRICFALTVSTPDPRRLAEMMGRRVERFARGNWQKMAGFTFTTAQNERLIRNLSGPITESPRRSTIMRWVEAAMHGDRVPRYLVDTRSSVEHVYARNPENNWMAFENGLEFNELATLREMIGNLCVLPQDDLGNAPFDEKRKAYARFRSRFANEIAKHKTWTPDSVRERTRKITEATLKFLALEITPERLAITQQS